MDAFEGIEGLPLALRRFWFTRRDLPFEDLILRNANPREKSLRLPPREGEASLGALSLPPELLRMIFLQLDPVSLASLKATNCLGRSTVEAVPEYGDVANYAPDLLDLLDVTKLAPHFPLLRIHDVLIDGERSICGQFAAFVFLPGLQRCCQRCAEHDIEFLPISAGIAKKEYGLQGKKRMDLLPKLLAIPGYYGSTTGQLFNYTGKKILISRAEARNAGAKSPRAVLWDRSNLSRTHLRNMCLATIPVLDVKSRTTDNGIQCKSCEAARAKHPVSCRCQYSLSKGVDKAINQFPESEICPAFAGVALFSCRAEIDKERLFSQDGMWEHVSACKESQDLKKRLLTHLKESLEEHADMMDVVRSCRRKDDGGFWKVNINADLETALVNHPWRVFSRKKRGGRRRCC